MWIQSARLGSECCLLHWRSHSFIPWPHLNKIFHQTSSSLPLLSAFAINCLNRSPDVFIWLLAVVDGSSLSGFLRGSPHPVIGQLDFDRAVRGTLTLGLQKPRIGVRWRDWTDYCTNGYFQGIGERTELIVESMNGCGFSSSTTHFVRWIYMS